MSWITTILASNAQGRLAESYRGLVRPNGEVANILSIHSLRPHTLEGHLALYKATLGHGSNSLPRQLIESVAIYVSALNGCSYCVRHHFDDLREILKDDGMADDCFVALTTDTLETAFDGGELAALRYARKLTVSPANMVENDLHEMRESGFGDGEILEINQAACYTAYANRTVLGLGVTLHGEQRY